MNKRPLSYFVGVVSTLLCVISGTTAYAQRDVLIELDHTLDAAEGYIDVRYAQIRSLEAMLNNYELSPLQRYNIYDNLYNEYFAFQFDKALESLDMRYDIASKMGSRELMMDVQIDRAMLYTTSAMFLEAEEILEQGIDTLSLQPDQLIDYYGVQHRFHRDFWHYTGDGEQRTRSGQRRDYYRALLLDLTPENETLHKVVAISGLTDNERWAEADKLNRALLATLTPDEHEYAMYSYNQARICEALDEREEMIEWFARSAIADIRTATRDNASLCSLATVLLECGDVDRAFRYITISLNDALFYNAKLRPWQISGVMPEIEKAYQEKQQAQSERLKLQEEHSRHLAIVISILAVALLGICCYMAILLLRLRRDTRKISEMNERIGNSNAELHTLNEKLEAINIDLREANAVKEEYIALFLAMCSDYIEKLTTFQRNVRRKLAQGKAAELEQELSSSSIMDEELQNFYDMFDNAFLNLYPNFVEEFNALLKPDSRIEPKRSERLNTELRIFALIRLGICDSSRIAALLRYSVNTIYNYRARTKNSALDDRDTFEERVKRIGK